MKKVLERVLSIQSTKSRELRDDLLRDLRDEAYRIASFHCKKLGREPSDEEYSIALDAMNEAIDLFNKERNSNFRAFASMVIYSRLIDFFRKEKTRCRYIALYPNVSRITDRMSFAEYHNRQFSEDLWDELKEFNEILSCLGYTWSDIWQNRPVHSDSIENLKEIAFHIVDLNIGERFLKENPLSRDTRKLIDRNRRTLKKYRPYLCALVIALLYDFPIIRSYLERGMRNAGSQRISR